MTGVTQIKSSDDELSYMRAGVEGDIDGMVIHSLLRTHSRLSPFLDATLRAAQLTAAQFNTLLLLRHSGDGGMLMSQIGEGLIVTKSNVTGLIERLAKQGLVERCDHHDRRATLIRLTDAGNAILDQALPSYRQTLGEVTDCLSDSEKHQLTQLLRKLRRSLREKQHDACSRTSDNIPSPSA